MAAAHVARPIGISRNPVIKTNFLNTPLSFRAPSGERTGV
jgi:hypothetical protein